MPQHHVEREPCCAFAARFPDANDGDKTGTMRALCLSPDLRTRLAVVHPPLRMAEDDSCGARLLQHFRRDITGMGSRRRGVTVLAGQHQPASPDGRRQRRYQRCRRGDHNVGAD